MSYASKYVSEFLDGMDKSGNNLYNQVIRHVKQLEEDSAGLQSGGINTLIMGDIAGAMQDFFNSPTYERRLEALINAFPKVSAAVTRDVQAKFGPLPFNVLEKAIVIQDQYQYALEGYLQDDATELAIISPYINQLFTFIGQGAEVEQAIDYTQGLRASLSHYFITKVTTNLEQFERALYALYADHFGATRFLYTRIKDSKDPRRWCDAHEEREYTKAEIQAWPEDPDFNEGVIPGTNAENIFINAAGFNCSHVFIPIP